MTFQPEYDAFIAEGVASGLSHSQIAEGLYASFGVRVTKDSVRGRIRYGHVDGVTIATAEAEAQSPEDRFADKVRIERERTEDRLMAREMSASVKAEARWQEFLDIFRAETASTPRGTVEPVYIPAGTGTPEMMVVLVGDVHIGKLVDPAVVGAGFEGYSVPIFERRLARLKDRVYRLLALNSATAPVERIRLYFLGDGVDGVDMRRGHAHRVDVQTATAQVLILVYAFERWVRELVAALGIPVEIVWEFGNHGRVGDFGVNLPADNWDYIAGQMLTIALRDLIDSGDVYIHADTLLYSITQLGPDRVYTSHNANIKGGDGFSGLPINGMARGNAKDTGLHQQLFDYYIMAHFHTPQDVQTQTGRIIMNGAWDGGDDYSVNGIKAASEPVQFAWGVHPTKGMTWQARIKLNPGRRQPSPVVSFP